MIKGSAASAAPVVTREGNLLMHLSEACSTFENHLQTKGLALDQLDASSAVDATLEFYRDERADDVDLDEDGDMLLFQWGTYGGASFQYDLTRQLIGVAGCDDDNFVQLNLTLHFDNDAEASAIEQGNFWCKRPGDAEVQEFRARIDLTAATAYATNRVPRRVELRFGGV